MTAFTHLLAKSCADAEHPPVAATLAGHTQAVLNAFQSLFGKLDAPSHLARRWLQFFRLSEESFIPFCINGRYACLFHDIGKANSGMQAMLRRKGRQLIRHEHLSGILLLCSEMQQWIEAAEAADLRIIVSAAVSHHLKIAPRNQNFADYLPQTDGSRFSVLSVQLYNTLEQLVLNDEGFPKLPDRLSIPEKWHLDASDSPALQLKARAADLLKHYSRFLKKNPEAHRLLLAVRSGLILADSAGSGLVRVTKDAESWLETAFDSEQILTSERIEKTIIQRRIGEIQSVSKQPFQWQQFQEKASELPSRTLLVSACGSGKTLAAWRWIKTQLHRRPSARAIFLYPTKATASEGFRDYVSWAPEGILLHSSSKFDLQEMFSHSNDSRDADAYLVEDRLFALAYWQRRIFSATVHQFLGFMQNIYRSVCLLPLLADSVVVIDEVHSFDKALFSALKQFLSQFAVPVLCMTATLPVARRSELLACGLRLFPEDSAAFDDLQRITCTLRYQIKLLASSEDAEITACEARSSGQKVLWVVNTVDRCQHLAQKLDALCYHSRFKLNDRRQRHEEIIRAFQAESGPLLAVTTQVCEMSLDLDADVLISESAPITSLIQRMGRCNRRLKRQTGEVYFYHPEDDKPYEAEDLAASQKFMEALNGQAASQNDLELLLVQYGDNAREVERYTAFYGDTAWAQSRELTDIKEHTVQAVLNSDLSEFWELRRNRESTDGLLLPVPRYPAELTWLNARIGAFPLVASAAHYDARFGFTKYPMEIII